MRRHHSRFIDECCPMTCALAAASRAVHDSQIRQPIRRNQKEALRTFSKSDFTVLYSCEQCSPQSATPGNYGNFGRHALRPPRMFATRCGHKVMSDLIHCPLIAAIWNNPESITMTFVVTGQVIVSCWSRVSVATLTVTIQLMSRSPRATQST